VIGWSEQDVERAVLLLAVTVEAAALVTISRITANSTIAAPSRNFPHLVGGETPLERAEA
jgi:hypothetical protein